MGRYPEADQQYSAQDRDRAASAPAAAVLLAHRDVAVLRAPHHQLHRAEYGHHVSAGTHCTVTDTSSSAEPVLVHVYVTLWCSSINSQTA